MSVLKAARIMIAQVLMMSFLLLPTHTKCHQPYDKSSLLESLPENIHQNFVVCEEGYAYCWNHKAASTLILQQFAKMCGFSPLIDALKIDATRLIKFSAPIDNEELVHFLKRNNTFVFTTVRHPFSRLVSAFTNRFIDNPDSWQSKKFKPLILKNPNSTLTFEEFLKFIISHPSSEKLDSHWTPITDHCVPHLIHFDAILKVESLAADFNRAFGLSLPLHEPKIGPRDITTYFSSISKTDLKLLYNIYANDFLYFNYNAKINA